MATSQIRLMFHRIRLAAVGVRAYYLFLPGFYDNVISYMSYLEKKIRVVQILFRMELNS